MKLLTTVDVARRANVSTDWIRKAARRGMLRAVRAESGVFIFRESDVDRWIARRRREAARSVLNAGDAA